jgi:hypothetical protein
MHWNVSNARNSLSFHNRLVQPGELSLSPLPDQPASGFTPEFISCLRITDLERRNIGEGKRKKGGNTQPKSKQKSDDVTTVDKETHRQARENYCLNWTGNRIQDGTYLFWRGKVFCLLPKSRQKTKD